MPTMAAFLKGGTKASGNGLLTQAPPNTGAGWYTLATGAWPGVHASTNNTFHKNGDAFGTARTAAFDPGVLQAESIAQSAERGGLKVAQVEWAGGRNATIQGPTIDFRGFFSGRGVATNFIGRPVTRCSTTRRSSAPSASSSTIPTATRPRAGTAVARRRGRRRPTGWTDVPASATGSPAQEMRLRVLDGPNPNTAPTSTASTPTSSTAPTTARSTTTRSCSRGRRAARHRTPSGRWPRASGPTSR